LLDVLLRVLPGKSNSTPQGRTVNPVPVALIGAIVIIATGLSALGTIAGSQHPRASVRQAEVPR